MWRLWTRKILICVASSDGMDTLLVLWEVNERTPRPLLGSLAESSLHSRFSSNWARPVPSYSPSSSMKSSISSPTHSFHCAETNTKTRF
jgi:hypothetical protein